MDNYKKRFQEALENPGIPINYQARYWNTNGYYFGAEGTFNNLLHVHGINAVVANFRDVTEKVLAEEKLVTSELRFRSLIENSAEGISLTDANNITFTRAPTAIKILGHDSLVNLRNYAHPDDIENTHHFREISLANPGVPFYLKESPSSRWPLFLKWRAHNKHPDVKGVEQMSLISNIQKGNCRRKIENKRRTFLCSCWWNRRRTVSLSNEEEMDIMSIKQDVNDGIF